MMLKFKAVQIHFIHMISVAGMYVCVRVRAYSTYGCLFLSVYSTITDAIPDESPHIIILMCNLRTTRS